MLDIQRCLAVQGYGAAGTIAVQGLLDGHPDILALPATFGLDPYGFVGNNAVCAVDEQTVDRFVAAVPHWFVPTEGAAVMGLLQMGAKADETILIDPALFRHHLREQWRGHTTLTRRQLLVSVYLAYNRCVGRDHTAAAVLLFPIHKMPQSLARRLTEDFTQVRFLHMVREPVQNFGSFARHLSGAAPSSSLLAATASLIACDVLTHREPYPVYALQPYFPDREDGSVQSRAVRLEDIHKRPRETLGAICRWLGIGWNDTLTTTTFNGKIWNNFAGKIKVSGVSEAVIKQQYSDMLNGFDSWRLALLLSSHRRAFDYCGPPSRTDRLLRRFVLPALLAVPFKVELLPARVAQTWRHKRAQHPDMNLLASTIGFLLDSAGRYRAARKWLYRSWRAPFGQNEPFVALLPIP